MKTQRKEEEEVKYNVAQKQMIVWYWKGRGGDISNSFTTKIHVILVRETH